MPQVGSPPLGGKADAKLANWRIFQRVRPNAPPLLSGQHLADNFEHLDLGR